MPRHTPPPVLKVGRGSRRPAWPRRLRRLLTVVAAFLTVLGLLIGALLLYLQLKIMGADQEIENLVEQEPSEPMNVLVLGSDSREALTDQQQEAFGTIAGKRADTIMLLHLDEEREKVVVISFPRDLRVGGPQGDPVKINGIYQQGPEAMVATVANFSGLPIHHYVEVDFNGFNQITRELGGVQIYFNRSVKDRDSGLDQPQGCNTIEGEQALAFVRARKIDDDFGRIRRQQLFLKLMVDKIVRPGTLLRPDKVLSLVNLFTSNVTHDADLTLDEIMTIGLRLRNFDSSNLDMRVVPSTRGAKIEGTYYVFANESQSRALFRAIAQGEPLPPFGRTGVSPIDQADIDVSLYNGTGFDKLAATEAAVLRGKGFQVFIDGNTDPHERTTVYYDEGYRDHARLIKRNYPKAVLLPKPESLISNAPVALVLGQDFADTKMAAQAGPSPGPTAVASPPPSPPVRSPAPDPEPRDLVRACYTEQTSFVDPLE